MEAQPDFTAFEAARLQKAGWWGDEVAAISNPPPTVNERRSLIRNLPITKPGVRQIDVWPGWVGLSTDRCAETIRT